MTDSRLQQLKRVWEASRSTEDEAAYLRERVRVGELAEERLLLAAILGSEQARRALVGKQPEEALAGPATEPTGPEPKSFKGLAALLRHFYGHEDEAIARAVIPAGWAIVEHYGDHGQDARRVLALSESLLCSPAEELLHSCRESLPEEIMLRGDDGATRVDVTSAAHTLGVALLVHICDGYDVLTETLQLTEEDLGDTSLYQQATGELDAVRSWVDMVYDYESDPAEAELLRVKDRESFDEVAVRRVREEIVAWTLGYSDPVRERVQRRRLVSGE